MKSKRLMLLLPCIVLWLAGCGSAEIPPTAQVTGRENCPVTQSPTPAFIPPSSYPPKPPGNFFYFGSEALWTAIPQDGVWSDLPKTASGFTQKIVWWHDGYSPEIEPEPALTVSGRRLDAPAGPFYSDKATNATASDIGQAMMTGVEIPSEGCWEITGNYSGSTLSFVVWVTQ